MTDPRTRRSPQLPIRLPFNQLGMQQLADAVNILTKGGGSNFRVVTLTANSATTTVEILNIKSGSPVWLETFSANARAMSSLYVDESDVTDGQVVINHDNDANADKKVCLMWRQ